MKKIKKITRNKNCVFCLIALNDNHPDAYRKITKESDGYWLLSSHPATRGNIMFVPYSHKETLSGFTNDELGSYFSKIVNFADKYCKLLKARAYVIKVNNGVHLLEPEEKRHISHIHFHIYPRHNKNEKLFISPQKATKKQLIKLSSEIKNLLK